MNMCGRYSLNARADEIVELFKLAESIAFGPRYNIAPTQTAPIIRRDGETQQNRLDLVRWGLTPKWMKDQRPIINVRSETIGEKPTFRKAFQERRCLVPATGFYEWQKLGAAKQPFHIRRSDQPIFAFAGIWDRFQGDGDEMIDSFAILTTSPNAIAAPIHNRMPVILEPAGWERWLDSSLEEAGALADLFDPISAAQTIAEPVSSHVNSASHDDERCLQPLAEGP